MFPSGPAVIPPAASNTENGISRILPSGLICPMRPVAPSVNHRLPSGPSTMSNGEPDVGVGNSVTFPLNVIRAILLVRSSVNHRFPSGPGVITSSWLFGVGIGKDRRCTCGGAATACGAVATNGTRARRPTSMGKRFARNSMGSTSRLGTMRSSRCATDGARSRSSLRLLPKSLIGRLPPKSSVGPVEVVEDLPFFEPVVEQLSVVDHHALEHPVELLGVDPVGPLHLPVQPRGGWLDVDVPDAPIQHVVVELCLELGAVVGLDDLDPERELLEHVVEE